MEATTEKSLYERLGKAEGIAALVDDIVENHFNNPAVKARYIHLMEDPDQLAKIRQHTINFLSAGSGGPEEYTGRDMETTHRGMNISEAEFMAVLDDILAAMDKHGYDEQTRKDVLAISYSLKDLMIRK